jgi:hypothetical protein
MWLLPTLGTYYSLAAKKNGKRKKLEDGRRNIETGSLPPREPAHLE